jgi:hypothetical protein
MDRGRRWPGGVQIAGNRDVYGLARVRKKSGRGKLEGVLTGSGGEGHRLNSEGDGGGRPWRPARTVQAEKEKAKGIRWERPRNCEVKVDRHALDGSTQMNS